MKTLDSELELPHAAPDGAPHPRRARNGAEALLETLVECGVDTIFGYPVSTVTNLDGLCCCGGQDT